MDVKTATFSAAVFCFVSVCAGEHHVTCSTEPEQPEEGDDITLQCRLDPPLDLTDRTLVVSRPDFKDEVHVYRDGGDLAEAQTSWYRDRTSLDHADLQRGVITLNISSLQLKDSGQYRLFIPGLKNRHLSIIYDIDLHVAEKGRRHQTTTTTECPRTRETPDAEPQRKQHAAVAGGVAGGVLLLGLIVGVIVGVLVKLGKISFQRRRYTPAGNTNHADVEMNSLKDKHNGDVHHNNNNNNNNNNNHNNTTV